jgi:dTDP-4-amino-4,6-dideoxygalactose transaminase
MKNAELLTEGLQGIDGLATPQTREGRSHVFHQYTVRVGPSARVSRDELRQQLTERGVETGVHYPRPLYRYDCYRDHPRVRWEPAPEAERAADEVLSLPVHPFLDAGDLEHIVSAVRSVLDG